MLTIALRELRALLWLPLGWCVLAVTQLILAYMFLIRIDLFTEVQADLAGSPNAPGFTDIIVGGVFNTASILFMLVIPVLAMRAFSEERRNRTFPLLLSAPLSPLEIVLGKYLGLLLFLLIMLAMVSLMPLSLLLGGSPDLGQVAAGLLGLLLLMASFAAISLYFSALTSQPAIAAISSFGALLLLWMIGWTSPAASGDNVLTWLSMTHHFHPLLRGLFNSADIVYYALVIALFLTLCTHKIQSIHNK